MAERTTTIEHAVVIVGAGPTGLMLAGELALAGVDVAIIERRPNQDLAGSRAGGLHARTIEVLDQRGIADRFLTAGYTAQVAGFAWIRLDISDFPTRHNYGLALKQNQIERILAAWVEELAVPIYRSREVTGFVQDDTGVTVDVAGGETVRAQYLVGCDGGRSVIRKTAGIDFPGWDPTVSNLIAEVEMDGEPELGLRRNAHGISALNRLEDGKTIGVMLTEKQVGSTDEPTLADLSEALTTNYGTDYGIRNPDWISRFTDMARQAESYRTSRVLLAGDAAHVHYPVGGQGLNLGVQDAVNLGWKLARVVRGKSPESLLDTYQAERYPVAARAIQNTLAQVALLRTDDRTDALREIATELLAMDEPRKMLAGMMSGLDVHYDLGQGHPLLGRRMPDLDLAVNGSSTWVYSLLHEARPVLLRFGQTVVLDRSAISERVQVVNATYDGAWELPVIGEVSTPAAVLIRPDGYIAWVGEGSNDGLLEACERWFGPTRSEKGGNQRL